MKKTLRVLIGVLVIFLFLSLPASTHALEVVLARLHDGEVRVTGKGAASNASISWQGVAVTTSTGGGSFNFTSSNIPATCVGTLSDGLTTLYIAVAGCSASGVTIPSTVAPVAATGQTVSYASGDDGFSQNGVPSPVPRFTDNLDGTLTDNLTGLIWLKDGGCPGKRLWFGALAAVDGLQDGVCGLTDGSVAGSWRLPNRNELRSLLYNGAGLPLDHPFIEPEDSSDYYWTSTTYPYITVTAWTVRIFEDGAEQRSHKGEDFNLVIAVRGGS